MAANKDAKPIQLALIVTPDPVCVGAAEPVADALALMRERHISCVVVVEGRRPVGLFTERDALGAVIDGAVGRDVPISARMTRSPLTCPSDMGLLEAYSRMAARELGHLVVTDAAGDVVGVATESDFAAALLLDGGAERGGEERFRRLFRAAPVPMVLTRLTDQIILDANPAAEQLFGWRVEEMLGRRSDALAAWVDDAERERYLETLRAGHTVGGQLVRMRGRGGHEVSVRLFGEQVTLNDVPCAISMFVDVTPQADYLHHIQQQHRLIGAVFKAIADALIVTDAEHRILLANDATELVLGLPAEQLFGRSAEAFLVDHRLAELPASCTLVSSPDAGPVRVRRADGELFPADISVSEVRDEDGHVIGRALLLRDVSARERRRRELAEQRNRLRGLIDTMADWVWEVDAEHRYRFVSERVRDLLGYEPSELLGRSAFDLMPPEEAERVRIEFADIVAAGEPFRDMLNINLTKDGEARLFASSGAPVRDQLGNLVGWRGTDRDITDARLAAERLSESERRYRAMFESAGHPMLALDPDGRITSSNRAACEFLRYKDSRELIGKSPMDLSPPTQPDGRSSDEKARELFRRALDGERLRFEWEHVSAEGEPLPVHVTLTRVDWGGESSLLVTWYDLTDRKRADALEQRATAVFENTAEGIMLTDAEDRIIAVNPAFSEITGYAPDEVLGQTPKLLQSGRQSREFYKRMWRQLGATGTWQGEVWNRRKDGEVYPQWLSISEIRGADGELVQRIAVFTDITGTRRSEEALEHLTHYDPITGLPNASLLRIQLEQALRSAEAQGRPLALLLLNLDGFKRIVATFGHEAADGLLVAVAHRLRELPQEQRILARPVGDTFAIAMQLPNWDVSPSRHAVLIQDGLRRGIDADGLPALTPTCCIGIATYPADAETVADLLRNADAALQRAKSEGAGSIAFYRPALTAAARRRIEIEGTLRTAFMAGQFELYFQPKLDLARRCVVGAEALIRWRRPDGVVVEPGEFMPVIEGTDLALALDRWVLRDAARKLRAWEEADLPRARVSVNISAAMLTGGNLPAEIESVVAETGVDPTLLEIEVLENILIEEPERAEAELAAVSELGVGVALDDFGTGYASLGYLKRFAFDYLKIDRGFITGLEPGSDDMAIVRATILMAHHLGVRVVAEGVERDDQIRQLAGLGCDLLQGYRIGRPMPEQAFIALLREGVDALGEALTLALARRVLLVSEDLVHFAAAERQLRRLGWKVQRAGTIDEARILLAAEPVDVLICDGELPDGDAIDFLAEARAHHPCVTRMLLTATPGADVLIDAVNRAGLFRCLTKPCGADELAAAVQAGYERGLARQRL